MSDRKAEILGVAKAMFAERGVTQTTMRQIGARAGVLSGSLYHHFDSKLDLVDAILSDFCSEVLSHYEEIGSSSLDALGRLRALIHYAMSLVDEHVAAVVIIQNETGLVEDPRFAYLVDFNLEVERRWVEIVRSGIDEGTIRQSIDAPLFYRVARDSILGAIRWYEPSNRKGAAEVAEEIADILLDGITVR